MNISYRLSRRIFALGIFGFAVVPKVQAAGFPEHAVTIVVPGPAGGSGDIVTRLIARELTALWDKPVVVENKPGAGGIIGAQASLAAPHDGYTLFMGNTGPNAINYSLYAQLPYVATDFVALSDVLVFPNVLIVRSESPYHSVAELVAASKKEPHGLTFASSGIGQTTHLSGELFKLRTGANVLHIPYKGANLGMQAVLAGEADFMFDNFLTSEAHIKAGRLRALAVTSAQRIPQAPTLPTMAEAGFPGMEITGWFGLFATAGTPPDRLDAIHKALVTVLDKPEVVERLRQMGGSRTGASSPAQFENFVRNEREQWGRAVDASGLKSNF